MFFNATISTINCQSVTVKVDIEESDFEYLDEVHPILLGLGISGLAKLYKHLVEVLSEAYDIDAQIVYRMFTFESLVLSFDNSLSEKELKESLNKINKRKGE